eukprot:CAMPEP_0184518976 /NCGR_PEP_ID=MMETSP0198_2-20121128/6375_1 /TAXON_ID=1112570 /ORGANISM="Thraustochytrium sp., Strain LLF1b" /LENGTH=345 /DNA_ID=CAMNT_0026909451 /DNA_START=309 /DNA_END=1343 /DNA_ORIENTATION=+
MGCHSSKQGEEALNEEVGKRIRKDFMENERFLRMLLLGAGDSGKTTITKQMRVLYGEGFSTEKRQALKPTIVNNLLVGAKAITEASLAGVAGKPLEGSAKEAGLKVLDVPEQSDITADIAEAIAHLWADPNFQATWEDRSRYQVLDGWGEFAKQCKNYPSWGGPSWTPSLQDSIIARARTSGIVEESFEFDGINFTLIDVGGQRNERRKWFHCFDGVHAVIFVAAISEYDQTLFEARDKNRLEEALELFQSVCEMDFFASTNIVLFLNKSDIFRHKLCDRNVPIDISGLFPDAPTSFDFDEGVNWMEKKFVSRVDTTNRSIFVHVTNATDTNNIKVVFTACKDAI